MNIAFTMSRLMFNVFSDNRREFYEDYSSALRHEAGGPDRLVKLEARARKRKTGWAPLYAHWLHKMRRMTFAHAMQHTVPDYEVMVLTAAEEDGRLAEAMDYLARALRLGSKVQSAYLMSLISPVMALLTLIGFFAAYALVIGPQNLEVLPLDKWPSISRQMYAFSTALVDGWALIAMAGAGLWWLIIWSRGHWYGSIRAGVDRVPLLPWRSYRERQANNFLVSLAILLQSNNYGPKEALERMRHFGNPWLTWHLNKMLKRLTLVPNEPAMALNTGIFPPHLMDRIEDYAERTDFTRALLTLAFDYGDKQVSIAERQAVISGFMAMLLVGCIIGIIVMANFEFSQAIQTYVQNIR
jgi:toxin co-regulated pilus biosynthesis protein E